MDANGGHGNAYPHPITAWWGVLLFTLGAILSYTDRQVLAILVDPIRASLRLAILLYAVAMARAGHLRATSQSTP
jgi:hypothetical protein